MDQMDENESFLNDVALSDEATFRINGCVNRHLKNVVYSETPKFGSFKRQHSVRYVYSYRRNIVQNGG